MPLSPEEITEIRARADIVGWIGARVSLKKRGQNHIGLCPFHQEKSPSFSVHAQKGMFYCFGCHAGGDLFAFVMQHEGVSFIEAAKTIARASGVVLKGDTFHTAQAEADRARDHQLRSFVARVQSGLVDTLWHAKHGAVARQYLKQRRIPVAQAHFYGLGYGPSGPSAVRLLELAAGPEKQDAHELAKNAGLIGLDSDYFLMSGRLTLPIRVPRLKQRSEQHNTIAWGGRQLVADPKGPKYLNTCESPLFKKGSALFGLDHAQPAIRQSGQVIFVEGFFDVLAANRAGFSESVASLGTALTPDHIRLIAHMAKRAILVFDADRAGEQASRRATVLLQNAGLEVFIAALPSGEDPDSLVRREEENILSEAIENARPALTHLIERAFVNGNLGVEAKAEAALTLAPLITSLRSGLAQDLYLGRLAAAVGVEVTQLKRRIEETKLQKQVKPKNPNHEEKQTSRKRVTTQHFGNADKVTVLNRADATAGRRDFEIISEVLLFPSLRPRYPAIADYLELATSQKLLEALAASDEPAVDIIRRLVGQKLLQERLCRIRPFEAKTAEEGQAQAEKTYQSIMIRLKCRHLDGALKDIMRQLKQMETQGRATDDLIRRKQDLAARRRVLRRAKT